MRGGIDIAVKKRGEGVAHHTEGVARKPLAGVAVKPGISLRECFDFLAVQEAVKP